MSYCWSVSLFSKQIAKLIAPALVHILSDEVANVEAKSVWQYGPNLYALGLVAEDRTPADLRSTVYDDTLAFDSWGLSC